MMPTTAPPQAIYQQSQAPNLGDKIQGFVERARAAMSGKDLPLLSPYGSGKTNDVMTSDVQSAQQIDPEGPSKKYVFQTEDKQPMPAKYEAPVDAAAQRYGVDPKILVAVLSNESGDTWVGDRDGDNGNAAGLSQTTVASFWQSASKEGGTPFKDKEEYRRALRGDDTYAINEAARVLKHKTDVFGNGDTFVGLMRYNGDGPDALKYAIDGFNRMGLPIPQGYQ
jgi:hypothetical protein